MLPSLFRVRSFFLAFIPSLITKFQRPEKEEEEQVPSLLVENMESEMVDENESNVDAQIQPWVDQNEMVNEQVQPWVDQNEMVDEQVQPWVDQNEMVDEQVQPWVDQNEMVDEQVQPWVDQNEMVDEQVQPWVDQNEMADEQVQPWVDQNEMVDEQNPLIISFLGIAAGQSAETAKQYLQASNWNVETAVGLFYSSSEDVPHRDRIVRAEMEHPFVRAEDNSELASLYRPPLELMHQGSFHEAKYFAEKQNKWLIVNVQSKREFSSNTLNLDTWAHEAVSQTIAANFIFWQVYDDVTEGQKVCSFYKLASLPAVLVLDPTTGQKMKLWSGMVDATRLLEDLDPFMGAGPKRPTETSRTTIPETTREDEEADVSMTDEPSTSSNKKLAYPHLPEEPKVDKTLLCRIGVRLPDGRRVQRNFLKTDPIQLLWSFCSSQLNDAESRPFQLTQAVPGASKNLDYEGKQTFEESGVSNSMISVIWD